MINNFHKVNNHLYRGGNLYPKDVYFLHKKYGINKIVSLDPIVAKRIDRTTKILGIKHVILPILINKRSSLLRFLHYDIKKMLTGGIVFVGCFRGADRTGLAIALYRCKVDGWSCNKAISEAKKYGFGIGVDPVVVNLYLKIIKNACEKDHKHSKEDINDAYDIVSNQREYPSDYADYTLDSWEQGSWSPYEDYRVRSYPYAKQEIDWPEQYESRQDYGLDDSDAVPKNSPSVPMVGQFDVNTQGISGAGPSMVGSGFI